MQYYQRDIDDPQFHFKSALSNCISNETFYESNLIEIAFQRNWILKNKLKSIAIHLHKCNGFLENELVFKKRIFKT